MSTGRRFIDTSKGTTQPQTPAVDSKEVETLRAQLSEGERESLDKALAEIGNLPILVCGVAGLVEPDTYILVTRKGLYHGGTSREIKRGRFRKSDYERVPSFVAAPLIGVLRVTDMGSGVYVLFAADISTDAIRRKLMIYAYKGKSAEQQAVLIGKALGARIFK